MLQKITQPTPLKKIYGASLISWSLSVKVEVDAGSCCSFLATKMAFYALGIFSL